MTEEIIVRSNDIIIIVLEGSTEVIADGCKTYVVTKTRCQHSQIEINVKLT
jgi:hypothetical protein